MIVSLTIKNLAIIEFLELEFDDAMTVLTGETGAGKSILIDALNIALGQRADQSLINHHSNQAEVTAIFNIQNLEFAQRWFEKHDIEHNNECILRRIIKSNGTSRALVNGVPVTLNNLYTLSANLVAIHSQHAHQQLLNLDMQRQILDDYGKHDLRPLQNCLQEMYDVRKKIREINATDDPLSRLDYLQYQLKELEELNVEEEDWQTLCSKQKQLGQSEKLIEAIQITNDLIDGDNGAIQQIHRTIHALKSINNAFPKTEEFSEMFENAITLCQEASGDMSHLASKMQLNEDELHAVENRISRWHELARKHNVTPEALPKYKIAIESESNQLTNAQQDLIAFEKTFSQLQEKYKNLAEELHQQRKNTSDKLSHAINTLLKKLHLPPTLNVQINDEKKELSNFGYDRILFTFQPNPGHPAQQLHKTASGGELSRLSLAIAVCVAASTGHSCLIFDEVDTGIGGETAETVGKLLKTLSETSQVFVITHQAQVAAQAHNHFKIIKRIEESKTITKVERLDEKQRVSEISRMIGGSSITSQTIAHATQILSS